VTYHSQSTKNDFAKSEFVTNVCKEQVTFDVTTLLFGKWTVELGP
jgi:hypothetical protein